MIPGHNEGYGRTAETVRTAMRPVLLSRRQGRYFHVDCCYSNPRWSPWRCVRHSRSSLTT